MDQNKIFGSTFDPELESIRRKVAILNNDGIIAANGTLLRDMCKVTRSDVWSYMFFLWHENRLNTFFRDFFRNGHLSHLALIRHIMQSVKNGITADPEEVFSVFNLIDYLNSVIERHRDQMTLPTESEKQPDQPEPVFPTTPEIQPAPIFSHNLDPDPFAIEFGKAKDSVEDDADMFVYQNEDENFEEEEEQQQEKTADDFLDDDEEDEDAEEDDDEEEGLLTQYGGMFWKFLNKLFVE